MAQYDQGMDLAQNPANLRVPGPFSGLTGSSFDANYYLPN